MAKERYHDKGCPADRRFPRWMDADCVCKSEQHLNSTAPRVSQEDREIVRDDLLKLNEWFPWATWTADEVGGYKLVWAEVQMGRVAVAGFVFDKSACTERVARCRTWRAALLEAKTWAWKQINAEKAAAIRAREGK